MNLNREQFLKAVERGQSLLTELKKDYPELKLKPVFSRFGSCAGQCDLTTDLRKIVMEFPEMLAGKSFDHESLESTRKGISGLVKIRADSWANSTQRLRELLKAVKQSEKEGEKETVFTLWKEVAAVEKALLNPELELYCGDVLIEFRPGDLKYESLRRLQQDLRLPPGLNTVGNIRVVAGSFECLARELA